MTPLGHYAFTPAGDGRTSTTSGEDEMMEAKLTQDVLRTEVFVYRPHY